MPIGPILGGWLLTNYWWGWVSLINLPIAVVRIALSFITAPLDPSPWWFGVYHSERAGSREKTFSCDIAYSDSPAASRASLGSR